MKFLESENVRELADELGFSKCKLKPFAIEKKGSLVKPFNDSTSEYYVGASRLMDMMGRGYYLLLDTEKETIGYYTLDEKDKMLEDYPGINILKSNDNEPYKRVMFENFETIYGNVVVAYCIDMSPAVAYMVGKDNKLSNILRDTTSYFAFFQNGQVFFEKGQDYEYNYIKKIKNISTSKNGMKKYNILFKNNFANKEIHGYSYEEVYDLYFANLFDNPIIYFQGNFINVRESQGDLFTTIFGYKEPKISSGKKQKKINKLTGYPIIDNEIANKEMEAISSDKTAYPVCDKAVINKLACEENVIVIRRFISGLNKDHARIYITKDELLAAFRNREGKWANQKIGTSNMNYFLYSIHNFEDYDRDIFNGTLLGYNYDLIKDYSKKTADVGGVCNLAKVIYTVCTQKAVENYLKLPYAKDIEVYKFYPNMLDRIFGKTKKGKNLSFYKQVGLNKHQLDTIYRNIVEIESKASSYSGKEDNIVDYLRSSKREHMLQTIVQEIKLIFSEEYEVRTNFVSLADIDIKTFDRVVDCLVKEDKISTNATDYTFELLRSSGNVKNVLERTRRNYSNKAFSNILDYVYEIAGKYVPRTVRRYTGDTINVSKNAVQLYDDYLKMVIDIDACDEFPYRFETLDDLSRSHDELVPIYNARRKRKNISPRDERSIVEKGSIWKDYEFEDDEFLITYPKSALEILEEGQALSHCVGSYVPSVAKGRTNIFFIRKKDDPDTPFFTLELNDNKVRQVHGKHNRNASTENGLENFIELWAKKNKVQYKESSANRVLGY